MRSARAFVARSVDQMGDRAIGRSVLSQFQRKFGVVERASTGTHATCSRLPELWRGGRRAGGPMRETCRFAAGRRMAPV